MTIDNFSIPNSWMVRYDGLGALNRILDSRRLTHPTATLAPNSELRTPNSWMVRYDGLGALNRILDSRRLTHPTATG